MRTKYLTNVFFFFFELLLLLWLFIQASDKLFRVLLFKFEQRKIYSKLI